MRHVRRKRVSAAAAAAAREKLRPDCVNARR